MGVAPMYAQPSNDECDNPVFLTPGVTCEFTTGTLTGATVSPVPSPQCGSFSGANTRRDVWFAFVATNETHFIETQSGGSGNVTDGTMMLYRGECPNGLTPIECDDDDGPGAMPYIGRTDFVPGLTYYIRFWAFGANTQGIFRLCVRVPEPPANDVCSGAVALLPSEICTPVTGTVADALPQDPACAGETSPDVWFGFVATQTVHQVRVTGSSGFNAVLQVFDGCSGNSLACVNQTFNGGLETATISNLTVGQTYYVRVHHALSSVPSTNTFDICVVVPPPPPSNDECSGARVLTPGLTCEVVVDSTTNASASQDLPVPGCANFNAVGARTDIWFQFVATSNAQIIETSAGTITDGGLALYSGECGNLTLVECDDDDGPGLMSLISRSDFVPGQTYYLRAWAYSATILGTFGICVREPVPPANDECAGAVELTVNETCVNTQGSTYDATQSQPGCSGTADDDVWFYFVATAETLTVRVQGQTAFNAVFQVFAQSCSGSSLACVNATGAGAAESQTFNNLVVGQSYYIRVYDASAVPPTNPNFNICVSLPPPPPPNDNCNTSPELNPSLTCNAIEGTTEGGTPSNVPAPNCAGFFNNPANRIDVWYRFRAASATQIIETIQGSVSDMAMALYSGNCNNLVFVECDDDDGPGLMPRIERNDFVPGNYYYVRLWAYSAGVVGTFNICVRTPNPPANDECSGAIALTVGSTCNPVNGTVQDATQSLPGCTGTANNDVWYSFVATGTAHIVSVTGQTGFDAVLQVLDGCTGNSLACVDNTFNAGTEATIVSGLIVGQTYYIRVYDWFNSIPSGTQFSVCVYNPPPPPANDECSAAVNLTPSPGETCATTVTGALSGATQSQPGCTGTANDDVWYSFVAASPYHVVIVTPSTELNAVVEVFDACSGQSLSCVNSTGAGGIERAVVTDLTVGQTYFARVYSLGSGILSNPTFEICVAVPPPPPANDNCSGAVALTPGEVCNPVSGSVANASQSLPGCTGTANNDVWYSFVATGTAHTVVVAGGAGFDAVVQVLDGCTGNSLACVDATFNAGTETATLGGLTPGQTYYVRVYDWYSTVPAGTDFTICVSVPPPPPDNDDCSGAFELTAEATCVYVQGNNENALGSATLPLPGCANFQQGNSRDVWYRFTATAPALEINSVAGTITDLAFAVYTGDCGNLALVECDDDDGPGLMPYISRADFVVGQTYYLRVWPYSPNVQGTFELCVAGAPDPPANDECVGAIALPVGLTCEFVEGTNAAATGSATLPLPGCANFQLGNSRDVWYAFVADYNALEINSQAGTITDLAFALYSGECGNLTLVECDDDDGPGLMPYISRADFVPGQTYYLRVWPYSPGMQGTYNLCVSRAPDPPANDDCSGAIALTVGSTCNPIDGTVAGATGSTPPTGCFGTANDDVWYSFVATETELNVRVDGNGSFDAVVEVMSACGGASLSCADATFAGGVEIVALTGLTVGQTYYVRVFDYYAGNPADPTFNICVSSPLPPPANDECDGAIVLLAEETCNYVTGTTESSSATINAPAGGCGNFQQGVSRDVWYQFVATGTTHVIETQAGAITDLAMALYTNECGNLQWIECDDDDGPGLMPRIERNDFVVGQTYYVRTWAYSSTATGDYGICVSVPPPPPANDECVGAVAVEVNEDCIFTTYNLTSSTPSSNPPTPGCAAFNLGTTRDVWFSFVATAPSMYINTQAGSVTDLGMALYSGSCGNLSLVQCDDDGGTGFMSYIERNDLVPGQTYYIRTWVYANGTPGTFGLCVSGPPARSCPQDLGDYQVVTLPYNTTSTTCGAGNDLTPTTVVACGNPVYFGGEDKVYNFTPMATQELEFSLTTTANYTALALFRGCPFGEPGGGCVAFAQSQFGSKSMCATVEAGQSYYLIIDTWPAPNCIAEYSLSIAPPAPAQIVSLSPTYCTNAPAVTLVAQPAGGTFSGPGVSGNVFNPGNAGVGTHVVAYTHSLAGCSYATTSTVTVIPPPVATVSAGTGTFCETDAPVALTATPEGGFFIGPGVIGSNFAPLIAGAGEHVIIYSVNVDGCEVEGFTTVTVNASEPVTIANLEQQYCEGASATTLLPTFGTYTGPGMTGNVFTPAAAGVGIHTITWTGVINGCTITTTAATRVFPDPVGNLYGLEQEYCLNAPWVQLFGIPSGGTFSGPGVVDDVFIPQNAGLGTHTITYSGESAGCTYTTSVTVTVSNTTASATVGGLAQSYTLCSAPATLTGTPSGGTFSGPGVIGNAFYPGLAGVGTHTINYSGSADGCNFTGSHTVTVNNHYFTGLTTSSPTCETCANGLISLTVYGPYQPFEFSLNGGAFQSSPTFSGLLPGTYVVTLRDTNGCEQPVTVVLSVAQPCRAPDNITVSNVTATSATITWTAVPGVQSYQVQYRLSTSSFWTSATTPASSITLSNLQPNTSYVFRIRSRCGTTVFSRFSSTFTFTTLVSTPPACPAPTITLTNMINSTSALVAWTEVAGATQYNLQYRRVGTAFWSTINTATTNALVTGLTPGVNYEFRVRARCETTTSAFSTTQTLSVPGGRFAAVAETAVRATVYPNPNRGTFTLSFDALNEPATVKIYDASGRLAHSEVFTANAGENVREFDLKLAVGLYLLHLHKASGAFFAKLSVE